MKKNVASQSIGAQMITAADGSAFTGAVTVYYTIDGGLQTIGSVGSGVCTHEGNGYHSYAPAQSETNGDHIAWTFIGSGAIATTVQLYTSFPQTVDNNVLAAGATGFAAIDTVVDAILADTNELQTNQGNWITATGFSTHSAADVLTALGNGSWATEAGGTGDHLTALATATALSTHDGKLDTVDANVDAILVDTGTTLPGTLSTIAGYLDTEIAAILEDTGTTLPALLADIPTVAEFEARTLAAASYFDPAADTVANVTTVGSVTTKTGYSLAADQSAVTIGTVTTLTGHTPQTGDTYALAAGATGFAAIDTVVDAIAAGLSAATIADAVWDEAQADHVAAGSFGEIATEIAALAPGAATNITTETTIIQSE